MASSVSGTGTISSAGLGSSLDVSSIISALMAVERKPLEQLQSQAETMQTKLSSVGKVKSYFSELQTKANALTSTTLWSGTTATASDTAVKVATSTGAVAGSYAVQVNRLAVGQTVTGSTLASASDTLSEGTLTIELGSYGSGDPAADFTTKADTSAVSISIGAGETSLSAIRDKINAAGAGVTATLVTDASGTRLSLRSSETGAENAFRISVSESADDGDSATGLSSLAYDATAASSPMSRSTTAANADLTINGIAVSSATNTLNNVVDGLTLTLSKTTTSAVDVTVAEDSAAIKTAITDFVTAFNSLASYIKTQTAYNADSKTAGSLQGDQSTLALQSQLRSILNQGSTASSTWSRLSDIGIAMKSDGTLETSTTKLDNAMGNLGELRKLLATDGSAAADSGFVRRFKRLADSVLASDGVFATRTAGLQSSIDRNEKSQEAMELRLEKTQTRLQSQYSALDTTMSKLNNLSSYLTQQISALDTSA